MRIARLLLVLGWSLPAGLVVAGTRDDSLDMALALVRHQAGSESYMSTNAFTYRVHTDIAAPVAREIPAPVLSKVADNPAIHFASDVSREDERGLDLSTMGIRAPTLRGDGDYDVAFFYNTCLRSGGYYGWDSVAVMRRDDAGWHVLSVKWMGSSQGRCNR
jgi:hypothetical protein